MTEPITSMRMAKAVVLFGWRKSQILNFEIALLFVDGFKLLKAIQLLRYPTNIYVCSFYWTSMAKVCVCVLAALSVSFISFFLFFLFLTLEHFYCCGFVHCIVHSLWNVGLTCVFYQTYTHHFHLDGGRIPIRRTFLTSLLEVNRWPLMTLVSYSFHLFAILFIVCSKNWKWSYSGAWRFNATIYRRFSDNICLLAFIFDW